MKNHIIFNDSEQRSPSVCKTRRGDADVAERGSRIRGAEESESCE